MGADSTIVILGGARTAIGAFLGMFSGEPAPALGASAIGAAIARSGVAPDSIDEVVMGCVLAAGLGQAPARQAALMAGAPKSAGCVTVNKMCGSGMKSIMLAHDALLAGSQQVAVAGGMENMSRAPHLLMNSRLGVAKGTVALLDHMTRDGLTDAYDHRLMGDIAEDCAQQFQFTRAMQDAYAIASLTRARQASQDGSFAAEIVAPEAGGAALRDETPQRARLEAIPTMRPAFRSDGTITAASSSAISDGAAALVVTTLAEAERQGLRPRAAIRAHATFADAPEKFPTAPIGAIEKLLQKVGWTAPQVDLYEINEAFAAVTMAAIRALRLDAARVNVHGGACALGHPIGASGARIVVTLLAALEKYGLKRGVAALCIGGGEATALAIERLD